MTEPSTHARVPFPVAAALGLLACGAVGLTWVLAQYWGANPEYADRFLILAGAAWAAWNAREPLKALPVRPALAGFVPLAFGAAAFPVGWFLQAQIAPRPVVLWWLAIAWLLAAAGVVLVFGGWRHLRVLAFPLAFVLFALPIPNRVLAPLQHQLQSATTAAAAHLLPRLGIPTERVGFDLHLPGGELRVVEACSGVRSVTALTAIAAFVAYLKGFGPARGAVLLALSVPLIAGVNAVRVVASGILQETAGRSSIRGPWHDVLGIGMVLLGLGIALLLARVLGKPAVLPPSLPASEEQVRVPSLAGRRAGGSASTILLGLSALATIAAQFLGAGTERDLIASAPLDRFSVELGPWRGRDVAIPEEITHTLTYDAAIQRVYSRPLEDDIHLWVIFWSSRNMVKGYHHPDECWPKHDFREVYREMVSVRTTAGGSVRVTVREFIRKSDRRLVLYWTQEGHQVWTPDDEEAVRLTGDSHQWLGERLFDRGQAKESGRLVVLIGTPTRSDGAAVRARTLEFTQLVADELYRVCPWAAVPGEPAPPSR